MPEPGARSPVPFAPHPPGPAPEQRPAGGQKSPIPFLFYWFLIPLIVLLVLTKLEIPQRLAEWIGLLW